MFQIKRQPVENICLFQFQTNAAAIQHHRSCTPTHTTILSGRIRTTPHTLFCLIVSQHGTVLSLQLFQFLLHARAKVSYQRGPSRAFDNAGQSELG